MTSEIRTNSLKSRAGLSTVTLTDSGPMFSGITTFVDNSGFTFGVGAGSSIFTPASNTLTFGTNSNERLRIDSGGRIGLGIANPSAYFSSYNRVVMGRTNDTGGMTIVSSTTSGGYISFADGTSGDQAYRGMIAYQHNGDYMTFGTDGGVERLRIDSSGRVRIANTNFNAAGNADELVIGTTSGNRGLTIVSGNTGIGALFFADDGSTNVGSLVYEHNTNQMRMNVAGQQVMRLDYATSSIPKWIIGNDLDTHISLPSANTFAFTTGGTERFRIDSNGDLNLGNNPTNQYGYKLNIQDSAIIYAQTASSGGTEAKWNLDSSDNNMTFGTVTSSDLRLVTSNNERLRIHSDGRISVGTNTFIDGSTKFEISGKSANTSAGGQNIHKYGSASALHYGQYNSTGDASLNNQANALLAFATNNTERLRITSDGKLFKGHTADIGNIRTQFNQDNQFIGSLNAGIKIGSYSNTAYASSIEFIKSRSATLGTNTLVQNGDTLGQIYWGAADGSNYQPAAYILAAIEGTAGVNDVPTRLSFGTTKDGASGANERMRLDRNGTLRLAIYDLPGEVNTANLVLGRNDANAEGGEMVFCRSSDNNPLWRFDCFGTGSNPKLRFHRSGYSMHEFYHNGNWMHAGIDASDRDLKENIQTLSGTSVDKIIQLIPKTFNFIGDDNHNLHTGFIAQEVKEVLPSLVNGTDGNKDMGVDHHGILAHLVNCVKELKANIVTLEQENIALRVRVTNLEGE